ncbi:MAG: hydantoinase B/oxoprolinase family protein [Protaetiibacter sp.]
MNDRTNGAEEMSAAEEWLVSDDVLDEIIADLYEAITAEMGWVVLRSAHSTYVKETRDFATWLVSTGGEVFAFPGELASIPVPLAGLVDDVDDWQPGDVLLTNDPYSTNGVVTHMPDLHLVRPVFVEGQLLCFARAFLHASDIGGSTPGSVLLTNEEVYQEGLRLRPVKLYQAGVRNDSVWNILLDNSRIPETIAGDLGALVAGLEIGERRVRRLVDKYGYERARRSIDATLDRTEALTRVVLSQFPKGEYEFVDYLEDDFCTGRPVRIQLVLRSDGAGNLQLDFHGSDPQVRAAINVVIGGQRNHSALAMALLRFVTTRGEAIRLNAGVMRCIETVAAEGSIMNAVFPAATGMRTLTRFRIHDVVMAAMNLALPGCVPAGGGGEAIITSIATSVLGGGSRVVVANPLMGGSGGGPALDGMSGSDYPSSSLRNVPVEILEMEAPAHVLRYALVPDSEGAGMLRGGFGLRYEITTTDSHADVVIRGKERERFEAWGFDGGRAAGVGANFVQRDGQRLLDLKKRTIYRPEADEVIVVTSPGGGGFGNPLQRDPAAVLDDCMDGLLSRERAESVYGVVVRGDAVDADATARARERLAQEGSAPHRHGSFDRGAARSAWEERYGLASATIARWLETLPVRLRPRLKERAFRALEATGAGPYTTEQVSTALAETAKKEGI